jgi:hypothetical protein
MFISLSLIFSCAQNLPISLPLSENDFLTWVAYSKIMSFFSVSSLCKFLNVVNHLLYPRWYLIVKKRMIMLVRFNECLQNGYEIHQKMK